MRLLYHTPGKGVNFFMVTEQEFYFPSSDGVHSCYAHVWRPEGTPRAVVQIVHGVAEYIDRYAPFASWLAGQGFLVAARTIWATARPWMTICTATSARNTAGIW